MIQSFEGLSLKKGILHNLRGLNITAPTPVQQEAIPLLLTGRDVIAQSQTGSGKTLAYTLPVLERIDPAVKKLQAVILVPTRELGAQVSKVIEQVSEGLGIASQLLIGGAAIARQIDRLRLHPQVVVGTPGRVLELIKIRKLSMHHVQTIIIDEADHIFEQGEGREVETVIRSALRDRQLCFFSATIPSTVRGLADRWMRDPASIDIEPDQKTAETLQHHYVVCHDRDRIDTLRRLVRTLNPQSGIVFTNQVDTIGEILAKLKYAGLSIEGLYSEAGKQDRAKVMKDFREGRIQLLLATDVAARGLDIPDVTHVFHFDLPVDADHYVHRSGRTGRMGKQGVVVALCEPQQLFILEKFSKALGISFEQKILFEGRAVSPEELPKRVLQRKAVEERSGVSEAGEAGPSRNGRGGPLVERRRSGEAARPGAGGSEASRGARSNGDAGAAPAGGRRVSGAGQEQGEARVSGRGEQISRGRPNPAKSAGKTSNKNKGAPRWLKEKRNPQG